MSTRTEAPSDAVTSTLERSPASESRSSIGDRASMGLFSYCAWLVATTTREVSRVAFWLATILPFVYLPAFVAGGAKSHPAVLAGLVALNGIAVVVGHSHNRPAGRRRP